MKRSGSSIDRNQTSPQSVPQDVDSLNAVCDTTSLGSKIDNKGGIIFRFGANRTDLSVEEQEALEATGDVHGETAEKKEEIETWVRFRMDANMEAAAESLKENLALSQNLAKAPVYGNDGTILYGISYMPTTENSGEVKFPSSLQSFLTSPSSTPARSEYVTPLSQAEKDKLHSNSVLDFSNLLTTENGWSFAKPAVQTQTSARTEFVTAAAPAAAQTPAPTATPSNSVLDVLKPASPNSPSVSSLMQPAPT